jgi:hypothetical protein
VPRASVRKNWQQRCSSSSTTCTTGAPIVNTFAILEKGPPIPEDRRSEEVYAYDFLGGEFAADGSPSCSVHAAFTTREPTDQPLPSAEPLGSLARSFRYAGGFASGFTVKPEANTRPAEGRAYSL